MSSPSLSFKGVKEFQKALNSIPESMQKGVYRSVITKGAQIVSREAKQRAKAIGDSGQLARSIGHRVSRNRRSAKIGARTGFRVPAPAGRKTDSGFIDPFKYAHLVELGTRQRFTDSGANRGVMKATPFLRPALERTQGQVMTAMATALRAGLDREIAKAERRQKNRR